MAGAIVEQQQREASRIGGSKMSEEERKARGIEERQFEKETLPGHRRDRPVQIETLEAIGRGEPGWDAAGGDPTTHDRQQATATSILRPEPPLQIPRLLGAGDARMEMGAERGLKRRALFGLFFGWERRGALGLACS